MISHLLFYSVCVVLAVIPLIFVFNKVYKDGIVGRVGLLGISFIAWTWIFDLLFNDYGALESSNRGIALDTMVAIFLVWHLFRFHRRVIRRDTCPPDCPQDRRHIPDRRFKDGGKHEPV